MPDWIDPVILNFVCSALGGLMIWFMKWLSLATASILGQAPGDELARGNVAVCLMFAGMFTGLGVATGLVIGPGLS